MRLNQDNPWLTIAALIASVAMGIGAYGLGSGSLPVPLLSAAFIALGFALALIVVLDFFRNQSLGEAQRHRQALAHRLDMVEQSRHLLEQGQQDLSSQVAELRKDSTNSSAMLIQSLDDLKRSQAEMAAQLNAIMTRPAPRLEAERSAAAPHALNGVSSSSETTMTHVAKAEAEPTFADHLSLALEPIIDLYTMQTAHYRMIATMKDAAGQEVSPEGLFHHAAQSGQRASLDVFVMREALGVLALLRQRDGNLCVIANIGAATLADPPAVQAILNMMAHDRSIAAGLVIEVSHAALASLPESSLEGLATLARSGVTLALGNASIPGTDLAALSKLNVRFVSLAAASVAIGDSAFGGFVQAARALRIQVIVTHVGDARQMQGLTRSARYASGAAFASPRRLKRVDQGGAAVATYNVAA